MTYSLDYGNPLYYRHSGQFSAPKLLLAVLASGVAAIVAGAVYAYVDLYNPCISVLTVLATIGFGAAVGASVALCLRWAHVRNDGLSTAVIVILALLALYSSWVFWVFAVLQKGSAVDVTPWDLVTHPAGLGRLILKINEVGVWGMSSGYGSSSSRTVSGIELWVMWAGEALAVVGVAIFTGVQMSTALPYCETCGKWCPAGKQLFSTGYGDPAQLRQELEGKRFDYFKQLGKPNPEERRWYEVSLHQCAQCSGFHTLSVTDARMHIDRKGNQQKKTKTVIDKMPLTTQEAEIVKRLPDGRIVTANPNGPVVK